jgi:hypothetical protein
MPRRASVGSPRTDESWQVPARQQNGTMGSARGMNDHGLVSRLPKKDQRVVACVRPAQPTVTQGLQ